MKRTYLLYEINFLKERNLWREDMSEYGEMPVEYIAGEAEFDGNIFKVSKEVLIPRIETEELVEMTSEAAGKFDKPNIAEIATGSGCIGISLAIRLEKDNRLYSMILSDISKEALEVTRINKERLLPTSKIKILQSDLFHQYPTGKKFDLIFANLPYIPSERMADLDPSVKDFEPHLALDGGGQGVVIINRLITQLPERLAINGLAILEIDETQELADFNIPMPLAGEIRKDKFGKKRFLLIRYGQERV